MEQDLLSKKVKKIIISGIENSSLHGLPNILRSKLLIVKITWTIILLVFGAYSFFSASKSVLDYFSRPVVTNINVIYDRSTVFPAVTICNLNPNLTIDQMLISCTYPVPDSCQSKDFVPTNIYSAKINSPCYTLNMGKDAYNKSLNLIKAKSPSGTLDLEIFTGNPSYPANINGETIYSNGLHVILHSHENYVEYSTGFYVATGKMVT